LDSPEVPSSLANKILKGYHSAKKENSNLYKFEQAEEVPIGLRKNLKRRTKINL
jgi:hypothetical protein